MRLRGEQVRRIAERVVRDLTAGGYIRAAVPADPIAARIAALFLDNLREEDALTEEAHRILREHSGEIARGEVRYQEMLRLVKQKLARERKFPL